MKKILLIVTGSIASYKALDIVSQLKKSGCEVTCVLTKSALEFLTPLPFASLSGNEVLTELFNLTQESKMAHINLTRESDLILVAPATANFISKLGSGIADDLASTLCLASDKPIYFAPAMNTKMWESKAVQKNIKSLINEGNIIINPASGKLACGEEGLGKMANIDEILEAILPERNLFNGKNILVTAGPTIEKIDSVRYISNFSSGKQGYAIAEYFAARGGNVTLISGPVSITPPSGVNLVKVTSADEMLKACMATKNIDIGVYAAAVADWKAKKTSAQKIKKGKDNSISLEFDKNPDVLGTISKSKNRPKILIGFAAETENLTANAKSKLASKNLDMVIANDVSGGKVFGEDNNSVTLITAKSVKSYKDISKKKVAELVGNFVKAKI
jgi:phosphopantothenoylcysteine decarboxylase/phosphopantothenate--cysteine ligase